MSKVYLTRAGLRRLLAWLTAGGVQANRLPGCHPPLSLWSLGVKILGYKSCREKQHAGGIALCSSSWRRGGWR
ncbi:hypothetical protein V8C86DRAFT_2547396 [Haematococcus lacustris]